MALSLPLPASLLFSVFARRIRDEISGGNHLETSAAAAVAIPAAAQQQHYDDDEKDQKHCHLLTIDETSGSREPSQEIVSCQHVHERYEGHDRNDCPPNFLSCIEVAVEPHGDPDQDDSNWMEQTANELQDLLHIASIDVSTR
jgi:hypothetical protein